MKNVEEIVGLFETDSIAFGAMYILPDGRMLDLSALENGHADFWVIAESTAAECKRLGWMRLNTKLRYIEKSDSITEKQVMRLNEALLFMGGDGQLK